MNWISLNPELLNTKIKFLPSVYGAGAEAEIKITEKKKITLYNLKRDVKNWKSLD